MDNALHRTMGGVADRVLALFRQAQKLGRIGNELAGYRITGVVGIDQGRNGRRNGHRITRGHVLQPGAPGSRYQAGLFQITDRL